MSVQLMTEHYRKAQEVYSTAKASGFMENQSWIPRAEPRGPLQIVHRNNIDPQKAETKHCLLRTG